MLFFIKQHGRLLSCCTFALLIFGMLGFVRIKGSGGLLEAAGKKAFAGMPAAAFSDSAAFDAARTVFGRDRPEICYIYHKAVLGTAVNVRAMFSAKDMDGNSAGIEILDICDEDGNSVLYRTNADRKNKAGIYETDRFFFPATGIYIIYVKAGDSENMASYGQYRLPVS